MPLPADLYALGRIMVAIKAYRRQTGDYTDPVHNQAVDQFLADELSRPDRALWIQLRESATLVMKESEFKGNA